ncbi:MAG: alpha-amylase/alpha-mannosidase [Planctomycetes bacterium]|nr:alpha-amylase/alpha-mannosidase [Planctomycetota bacterium]
MTKIYIAFLWHHHQPYYKDIVTGRFAMPWVHKHGIKDYYGLAALCSQYPKIRMNFNLVPSLLSQIQDYSDNNAHDIFLELSAKPVSELSISEKTFILKNFFSAQLDTMITPHERYHELYAKTRNEYKSNEQFVKIFSDQDIRDLQCWNNLAWFHPVLFESDPHLFELKNKQREFSENDKNYILTKIHDTLAQIIPLHKKLQDNKQIEISTTPFYHPILPLLCNMQSARVAMPNVPLPHGNFDFCVDADNQLKKAVDFHTQAFGAPPKGLWPSEGSVSPEILPFIAKNGFSWFATDELNLFNTINRHLNRNANGELDSPEILYKPYKITVNGSTVHVIFRDHKLSDMFGFDYQRYAPEKAVNDFFGRLEYLKNRTTDDSPFLVSIILDGENPWEHYPNNGMDMLRPLFKRLSETPGIETVRISDFINKFPNTCGELKHIHSGSWIKSNFSIWVGEDEDNAAWTCLRKTREVLEAAANDTNVFPARLKKAWECLYAAEGSDWFWWYGNDFFTPLAAEFDGLFRKHLMNAFSFLRLDVPAFLYEPIKHYSAQGNTIKKPESFLNINLDGKISSYFEWISAGRYSSRQDKTVMEKSESGFFSDIYFGFDRDNIYLRLDTSKNPRESFDDDMNVHIIFTKPSFKKIVVKDLKKEINFCIISKPSNECSMPVFSVAMRDVMEIACPLFKLGFNPEDTVEFCVELKRDDTVIERVPSQTMLKFQLPPKDFETVNWQA